MSARNILLHTPICVDHFQNARHGYLYFLTHIHSDHTVGLSKKWCFPIYMTEVTKRLVMNKFHIRKECIKVLELNQRYSIKVTADVCVHVTCIDANHCPGAVMFLFEGYFGTVLHTGDFRYYPGLFIDSVLSWKQVDCVYLDNTYGNPQHLFPSRAEAMRRIIDIISRHPTHNIKLAVKGLVGKDALFVEIAQSFQRKVCVSKARLNVLTLLNVTDVLTCDSFETNIEVIEWKEFTHSNVYYWNKQNPTVVIAASAFNTTPPELLENMNKKNPRGKVLYVPYSDHSSYDELCTFLSVLKPRHCIPTVRIDVLGTVTSLPRHLLGSFHNLSPFVVPESVEELMKHGANAKTVLSCSMSVDPSQVKASLITRNQKPVKRGVDFISNSSSGECARKIFTTNIPQEGRIHAVGRKRTECSFSEECEIQDEVHEIITSVLEQILDQSYNGKSQHVHSSASVLSPPEEDKRRNCMTYITTSSTPELSPTPEYLTQGALNLGNCCKQQGEADKDVDIAETPNSKGLDISEKPTLAISTDSCRSQTVTGIEFIEPKRSISEDRCCRQNTACTARRATHKPQHYTECIDSSLGHPHQLSVKLVEYYHSNTRRLFNKAS